LRIVIMGGRDAYLLTDLLARHEVPVVLRNIVGEPPREDDPYDVLYSLQHYLVPGTDPRARSRVRIHRARQEREFCIDRW
jgi:hypothetical protein